MAIQIVEKDLLEAFRSGFVNVIGHQCNMQNNMGAGIARQIAQQFPEAQLADKAWYLNGDTSIPTSRAQVKEGIIYNLYGQRFYGSYGDFYKLTGRQTDYNLIKAALKEMALRQDPAYSIIGFPYKMSSDLAGGDWNTILGFIDSIFTKFEVVICKLPGS